LWRPLPAAKGAKVSRSRQRRGAVKVPDRGKARPFTEPHLRLRHCRPIVFVSDPDADEGPDRFKHSERKPSPSGKFARFDSLAKSFNDIITLL